MSPSSDSYSVCRKTHDAVLAGILTHFNWFAEDELWLFLRVAGRCELIIVSGRTEVGHRLAYNRLVWHECLFCGSIGGSIQEEHSKAMDGESRWI